MDFGEAAELDEEERLLIVCRLHEVRAVHPVCHWRSARKTNVLTDSEADAVAAAEEGCATAGVIHWHALSIPQCDDMVLLLLVIR